MFGCMGGRYSEYFFQGLVSFFHQMHGWIKFTLLFGVIALWHVILPVSFVCSETSKKKITRNFVTYKALIILIVAQAN